MNKKIWLSLAHMSGREQDFIKEAFDTNWVVPLGPNVNGFEADLEKYIGKIPRNLPLDRLIDLLNYAELRTKAVSGNNKRIKLIIQ